MTASPRRSPTAAAALTLLTALTAGAAGSAHADSSAKPVVAPACRLAAQQLTAHAARLARINHGIALLLNAGRYRQAALALRGAARRQHDAWAGDALGGLYAAGLGVPRSARTAFHWYLWSARQGDQTAARQVANAYFNGEGTPRDLTAATQWFDVGIAPWQLAGIDSGLARTYARGDLFPANPAKAAYYTARSVAELRALVRKPSPAAAYFLGLAYSSGHGVPRDPAKAARYLCRAVRLGSTAAAGALEHLKESTP